MILWGRLFRGLKNYSQEQRIWEYKDVSLISVYFAEKLFWRIL